MRKGVFLKWALVLCAGIFFAGTSFGSDIELAKKSTLEHILKNGELRVGFEAGYMPFEMTDKKGQFRRLRHRHGQGDGQGHGRQVRSGQHRLGRHHPGSDHREVRHHHERHDRHPGAQSQDQLRRPLHHRRADHPASTRNTKASVKSYKDLNDPKFIVTSKLGTTGEQAVKRHDPQGHLQVL